MESPSVSFVIPALNEEAFIGSTLAAIRSSCPPDMPYEIVVVDNGSSDATVSVARAAGAEVLIRPRGTVGYLRNEGARWCSGRVVVFLDADIKLSRAWSENISRVVSDVSALGNRISGSACSAAPSSGWVAKAWSDFSHRRRGQVTHIGTGHMIVEREAFLDVGGFDPALETGEDFEFCRRAAQHGFELRPEPKLFVTHSRLPETLRDFLRREVWHGRGDAATLRGAIRSRVNFASALFFTLHVLTGVMLWDVRIPGGARLVAFPMVGIGGLCLWGAVRRGGIGTVRVLLQRAVLFYVYFWGRFISLVLGILTPLRRSNRPFKNARGW